jgi:phosphoglucosamine mutase
MPTAGVSFLVQHFGADAGAVITASHNPLADNGLKIFDRKGIKYSYAMEAALEQQAVSAGARLRSARPLGRSVGRKVQRSAEATESYLEFLTRDIHRLSGATIAVDCANGASALIAPEAYRQVGARVIEVASDTSGNLINCGVGATNPEYLTKSVIDSGADFGFAHDGDADRLIGIGGDGTLIDGIDFLAILALKFKKDNRLSHNTIVTSKVSNSGLAASLERKGINVATTDVGDRCIFETMQQGGYVLGGEHYGNIITTDRSNTGDGILCGMRILDVIATEGRTLEGLASDWEPAPQHMIDVPVPNREFLKEHLEIQELVEAERNHLKNNGRLVVRTSTIESIVRIMCEASDADRAQAVAEKIADAIFRLLD